MFPPLTTKEAEEIGYSSPKILATGECAAIRDMLFTTGLFVGLNKLFYRTRFCYPDRLSAEAALEAWDGRGDPPGPWIKEKGEIERTNPKNI